MTVTRDSQEWCPGAQIPGQEAEGLLHMETIVEITWGLAPKENAERKKDSRTRRFREARGIIRELKEN